MAAIRTRERFAHSTGADRRRRADGESTRHEELNCAALNGRGEESSNRSTLPLLILQTAHSIAV